MDKYTFKKAFNNITKIMIKDKYNSSFSIIDSLCVNIKATIISLTFIALKHLKFDLKVLLLLFLLYISINFVKSLKNESILNIIIVAGIISAISYQTISLYISIVLLVFFTLNLLINLFVGDKNE